jgi:hypothetical protein
MASSVASIHIVEEGRDCTEVLSSGLPGWPAVPARRGIPDHESFGCTVLATFVDAGAHAAVLLSHPRGGRPRHAVVDAACDTDLTVSSCLFRAESDGRTGTTIRVELPLSVQPAVPSGRGDVKAGS